MITYPKTAYTMPMQDYKNLYPLGDKVFVSEVAIKKYCGIFNPFVEHLAKTEWEVLNYHYVVGSRGATACAVVVGVPYGDWATLQKSGWVPSLGYGLMRPSIEFGDRTVGKLVYVTAERSKTCILIISNTDYVWAQNKNEPEPIDIWANGFGD